MTTSSPRKAKKYSKRNQLPDEAFFTAKEIKEAYRESLDETNLSPVYNTIDDMWVDLFS